MNLLRQQVMPLLRESRVFLGSIIAPLACNLKIEEWPALLAWVYKMNVPKNVKGNDVVSPVGGSNIKILLNLIKQTAALPGDIAECGVYKGGSILTMGTYLRQQGIDKKIFGFDSFEGFGDAVAVDRALGGQEAWGKVRGGYGDTTFENLQSRIRSLGLTASVLLRKGYFEQTLPVEPERSYCFVHLDCDLYDSYKTCLQYFYPLMPSGGIILLDEYDDPPWPGCNKAVEEFLAGKTESLSKIIMDNQIKYYIKKV